MVVEIGVRVGVRVGDSAGVRGGARVDVDAIEVGDFHMLAGTEYPSPVFERFQSAFLF